ncbi:hypothetical protein Gasu2_32250 [Galdieria sulphuraria]|uniref:Uncharacterized protein n=1 Tax=Galdieria sulphuraria TaxID=130081 RepID=M2W171_GALSU|nr:uncharacterized protein Gasu_32080 [Galdieria sulphuraria]EME29381.1 hypothetical protein Gasu_32080 [Galdieria sulphuraria]GJD08948.1 hypothetical protein Gasu2_32250 [Galdieria sulphuraria]|eukprot:XP_005705901.1 hypothetical protein Gasu_32080 [Galdieria sulphuraria]
MDEGEALKKERGRRIRRYEKMDKLPENMFPKRWSTKQRIFYISLAVIVGLLIRDEETAFYQRKLEEKTEGYATTIGSEMIHKKQGRKEEQQ